jgi:3'(2'), 5'-bisphosphate nucleotidase
MTESYERELAVAIAAVREAAVLCRAVQAEITPTMLEKKDRSPVTVADFGSQAIVCRHLSRAFANDPVIAEEDSAELREAANASVLKQVTQHVQRTLGDAATADAVCRWIDWGHTRGYCERFWTLDPIDGTKGFLRGEQYAVSLALIVRGEIVVAALACPNLPVEAGRPAPTGAIFAAVRAQGATVQAMDGDGAPAPVQVSRSRDSAAARFCESVESGHSSHGDAAELARRLGITAAPVRMDSQAKYAVVARGEADIYLRLPTRADYREKIWDHAGGVLIVTEAGGRATDVDGKPLEFHHGAELVANRGVIVTNGPLHAAVLAGLAAP